MTTLFIVQILIFILTAILCYIGIINYKQSVEIRVAKNEEQEKLNNEYIALKEKRNEEQQRLNEQISEFNNQFMILQKRKQELSSKIDEEVLELKAEKLKNAELEYSKTIEAYTADKNAFLAKIQEEKDQITQNYNDMIIRFQSNIQDYKNQINDLKSTLSAAVEAQLREREKEENLKFYKLSVDEKDQSDLLKLLDLRTTFRNPEIISKLIWSNYFQKQTTDLCNRILGTTPVCGIYKITNIQTNQVYVGQSVNIAERWKQHIKCGLGIDMSSTSKLYKSMLDTGVWNFTFELIEKCDKEQLNEKEKQWIDMYQTDKFGYNMTKGNK